MTITASVSALVTVGAALLLIYYSNDTIATSPSHSIVAKQVQAPSKFAPKVDAIPDASKEVCYLSTCRNSLSYYQ